MSRDPVETYCACESKIAEEYTNFVCERSRPKAVSMTELIEATKADPSLINAIKCIGDGTWYQYSDEDMAYYQKVSVELCV